LFSTPVLGKGPDFLPTTGKWPVAERSSWLGALRGIMAERGIRGPVGSFIFLNLRLLNDQSLENATGVGAPPWTWPVDEQVIDIAHKGIYAWVTSLVADRLISGPVGVPAPRRPWSER
jgi:hypothetical protein